ncbi:ATP-binding cassette domain-containing protein [Ferrimonas balearica]|uniref:ATP-binding cassette domain-containing protein n=1 Tax=Ferrimonas balearica TaxID=44012 RepID=UPI001C98ED23|nr:ATP-binding cassette domain-containing protein [Ferrimonas balearica]MBY5922644.1 ATP-binding cassette domain-containing protein [Ferrimonas balearica]MBY5995628.1 ATP-binding cassette domain-containing protein [Ferrimonas balearica]
MSLELELKGQLGEFAFDLSLSVPVRGVIGVFGPSGVGKTSLFRAICGLERGLQGRIVLNGDVLQDSEKRVFMLPEHRKIGVVFQDSRLFPHLTVRQNLRLAQQQAAQPQFGIEELAEACQFTELLDQPAPSLSAGQRQRVAIARALAASPRLLLLDEPLAALDLASRQHLMAFLNKVSERIPMLFISHSVSETLHLCDPIITMGNGHIERVGGPDEIGQHLPRRRGHGRVVRYNPETGELVLQLDDFAPDFEANQTIGLVSQPSWLKGRD